MQTPEQQLAAHRARIDAIDETLTQLLIERTQIVAQVGALKNATWPRDCHIRPGREARMHRSVIQRFSGSLFSVRAALLIWRQIIGASTALESPLKVAVLSADHRPRARNYFGANAQITLCASLSELAEKLADKTCTIALEWAARYPTRLFACAPICTAARHSAQNIAFHEVGRQAIMTDVGWSEGRYLERGTFPVKGLAVARMTAHVTYLSQQGLQEKFGRRLQNKREVGYGFDIDFQVESYLRHQGQSFTERFFN
jgi:chorismate mutase